MTLTNETIVFTSTGIYIQPVLSDRFRFTGSVEELISIMVQHHELDIDNTRFLVREFDAVSEQMVHGNLCRICRDWHNKDYDCTKNRVRPRSEEIRERKEKYGITPDDI